MHAKFVPLLTILWLLDGVIGQTVGTIQVYPFQPVANHTYPTSQPLQVRLRVEDATLAL
jgi:hypothetical protein